MTVFIVISLAICVNRLDELWNGWNGNTGRRLSMATCI